MRRRAVQWLCMCGVLGAVHCGGSSDGGDGGGNSDAGADSSVGGSDSGSGGTATGGTASGGSSTGGSSTGGSSSGGSSSGGSGGAAGSSTGGAAGAAGSGMGGSDGGAAGAGGSGPECPEAGHPKPPKGLEWDLLVSATTGNDATLDGHCSPFKTITAALAVAEANDVVWVAPGTYNAALGESFPIKVPPNVSLIGDEPNLGHAVTDTLIKGEGSVDEEPDSDSAVLITFDGATVAGLVIESTTSTDGYYGVYVDGATTVRNCTLEDGVALFEAGADGTVVTGSEFSTSLRAVTATTNGTVTVSQNTFLKGALMNNGSNMTVSGNTFSNSGSYAVLLLGGTTQLSNNTFNAGHSTAAIRMNNGNGCTFRNNVCTPSVGPCVSLGFGTPDFGTTEDPGGNTLQGGGASADFVSTSGSTVNAIGNTWSADPPVCGTHIDASETNTVVVWGEEPGEQCP